MEENVMTWKILSTFISNNKYYSILLNKDTGELYTYCYEENKYAKI